jgi:hypothetical protein
MVAPTKITPHDELGSSWQVPAWHIWTFAQIWQGPPPLPQAWLSAPPLQVPPAQHPEQEPGPHRELSTQVPSMQVSSGRQLLHACPHWPQALASMPPLQVVPSQQPSQVAAEQATPEQDPCRQIWSIEHVSQLWPPDPHASVSLPDLQAPFSSQHPAQTLEPQLQPWLLQS